ncbi:glycoside hydrolase family 19 protein [Leisingera caerulea]|uniref:glycoside hydrolase family 19 protein n=1 Tax=Leisingera caerulea TaxID=506591 RepID=UPI0021A46A97|nr:glycoside hydrolase family 19 protein [Leisingera caerulea]UWQ64142.1 glycoside hydrolase family 19 protein [Leisingera caerulea]
MTQILDFGTLQKITGPMKPGGGQERNARSFLLALNEYGFEFGLERPHRASYLLGQVLLESGAFRYDRELWGPTSAQRRYDIRTDLGNTPERDGDGFKYRGRTPMQITGRGNYAEFTAWVCRLDPAAPDFVEDPDAVNLDPWEGLGALWYWDTRGLNVPADAGSVRRVTKLINGGYNHYLERLRWTDKAQLVLLGYSVGDVRAFQCVSGVTADGRIGPNTRAAMHKALCALPPISRPQNPEPVPRLPHWFRRFLALVAR